MKPSASFFCNTACEWFPCHDVADTDNFNCLFCYCPLYTLPHCGGNCRYTADGIKDCSACTLPHKAENYTYILDKLRQT